VTFRDGTIPAVRAVSVGNAGATLRFNYEFVNGAAVTVPNENVLGALRNDPNVFGIIPDRPMFAFQKAQKKPDNPGGGGGNGYFSGYAITNPNTFPAVQTDVTVEIVLADGTVLKLETGIATTPGPARGCDPARRGGGLCPAHGKYANSGVGKHWGLRFESARAIACDRPLNLPL
jgi:hypothetical protein